MIRSLRTCGLCLALGLALPSLLLADTGLADTDAWDQAEVSQITSELVPAVEAVYDELRRMPISGGDPRDYYQLRETTRRARGEVRHLEKSLAAGEGHDPTLPIFQQLLVQVHDAQELARHLFVPSPLHDKLAKANALIKQLGAYYTKTPEAESPGRS